MDDAQRYRMNAAECLSAAERCGRDYHDFTLAIAEAQPLAKGPQDAM
jgi:hypothetical protein